MRLLITTEPRNGHEAGDILAVLADGARLGVEEDPAEWAAAGRDPAAFPNPWLAVVDIDGEPVDLNLAEPLIDWDPHPDRAGKTRIIAKRAWRVDLDALRRRERAAVDAPGGRVALTAARARQVVRHRTGTSMPLRVGAQADERRAGTDEAARLGRAPRPVGG